MKGGMLSEQTRRELCYQSRHEGRYVIRADMKGVMLEQT